MTSELIDHTIFPQISNQEIHLYILMLLSPLKEIDIKPTCRSDRNICFNDHVSFE